MKIIDVVVAKRAEKLLDEIEHLQEQMDHENYTTPLSVSTKNKTNKDIDIKINNKILILSKMKYI